MGPEVGAKSFDGHEVNLPSEQLLQEEDQAHEVSEGGLLKLNEDVDVACLLLLPPGRCKLLPRAPKRHPEAPGGVAR